MSSKNIYVPPGMPELNMSGRTVSFFEFWPTWLMYIPVIFQWLLLGIRYRSLALPLIANPSIPLSGMVGVPKSTLLSQASDETQKKILPWFVYTVTQAPTEEQLNLLLQQMSEHNMTLPIVGKPDIGCRGAGVKLLKDKDQLTQYLMAYPENTHFMIQQLSSWEPEAGVFYVRKPNETQGQIISLALKYSPYVIGDGKRSLGELLEADPRASQLQHLYQTRHRDQLKQIINKDEPFRLVFSVSHCKGAIFRNGAHYITEALTRSLDKILAGIPEFYYGRLDIKFSSIEKLIQGEDIEIIEINTASSESLHIWDRNASLGEAVRALLFQYKTLFEIGKQNRDRGYTPPDAKAVFKAWKKERQLVKLYPEND